MSEANNICKQCGGVTGPFAREVVRTLNMLHQQGTHACIGHPEPSSKHDGDLGHNATVCYQDNGYLAEDGTTFSLEEVSISDKTRRVYLTPSEALSLLAWLRQEENKLQQLAQEDKA